MIDTAGPDESAGTAPADAPSSFAPHQRSKADWLNWKPHDDTAQVSGMLQQLAALKGGGAAPPAPKVAVPTALAQDMDDLNSADDKSEPASPEFPRQNRFLPSVAERAAPAVESPRQNRFLP